MRTMAQRVTPTARSTPNSQRRAATEAMIVLTTPSDVTSSVISGNWHMAQIMSSARPRIRVRISSGVVIRRDWPNIVAPTAQLPWPLTGWRSPRYRSAIGCRASPIFTTAARLASTTRSVAIGPRLAAALRLAAAFLAASVFMTSSRCFSPKLWSTFIQKKLICLRPKSRRTSS